MCSPEIHLRWILPKGERTMTKLNRPPKYSKLNRYAVVYQDGKPHYLGIHGSQESNVAYARFLAELQTSPAFPPRKEDKHFTVRELAAAFLDHAEVNIHPTDYGHFRMIVLDFLDKLYGDNTPIEDLTPRCLKLVRDAMIQSRRFCRGVINSHTLDRSLVFLDDKKLPSTSNAVERDNRRFRKMQKTVYRVLGRRGTSEIALLWTCSKTCDCYNRDKQ
jgi:hypothetical protein